MSAQDHLNPRQFMSVKELGQYESMDYPGHTIDQVHQLFRHKAKKDPEFRGQMNDLRGDIGERGLRKPVFVNETEHMYGNGHHRFSAAKSLGLEHLPVTHAMIDSVRDDE